MKEEVYDLIIIGGGPAGMTAGIYASRQKLKTLLITKEFGGQMAKKAVKIENYPGFLEISGQELIEKFLQHLKKKEIEITIDEVIKIEKREEKFVTLTKGEKEFFSKSVIVASGMNPRMLQVKGEKEFLGRGVSYCVVCDGPLFREKTVAVIGGGNAGFEASLFLSSLVKKIYILEFDKEVKADEENQELAKKTGKIEVITSAQLKEIKGENFVQSLIYLDRKNNEEKELRVEGVFIEIGGIPATSFLGELVDFNEKGEIIVDKNTMATKTAGLFAAGDCTAGKYKQIVIAAGEGARAALFASEYLKNLLKKNL